MKILIFGKADFDVVQLKEKLKVELKESRFAELEVKYRILPLDFLDIQSPNQKIPDRKTKCVIKTHINIKQNVIFGAKLKPV